MKNIKQKLDPKRLKVSQIVIGVIALFGISALVLATGLLFSNPHLALVVYALGGIILFTGNHVAEQKAWQNFAQTRLSWLNKKYSEMTNKVNTNHHRLELLEAQVARISMAQKKAMTSYASRSSKSLLRQIRSNVQKPSTSRAMPSRLSSPNKESPTPLKSKRIAPPMHMAANDRNISHLRHKEPVDNTLSDIVVKELLHHAVKEKDIALFVQPIVRLLDNEVKFYEVFGRVRAREGAYIPAARYMGFARHSGIMENIDHQVLMHCLKGLNATRGAISSPIFFLNVEPRSIQDPEFMNAFLTFLENNTTLAKSLILEIPQLFFEQRERKTDKILHGLKALGCSFSLDHVRNLHIDLEDLHRTQVRFVKISSRMMLQSMQDVRTRNHMVRVKRLLENNGIDVIVEKIESETMLESLQRFEIRYGQGYLFGRPESSQTYGIQKVA